MCVWCGGVCCSAFIYLTITPTMLSSSHERARGRTILTLLLFVFQTKIPPFSQVSKCLVHRSTKVGSWKYCLLVKSPTLDRPLKSQTCLEIYCHKHIDLSKTCSSLESFPQTRLLMFAPAEGNQEPRCRPEPSSHPEETQGAGISWLGLL